LEEKLSNKLKDSHENSSGVIVSMVLGLLDLDRYPEIMKIRDLQGSQPYIEKKIKDNFSIQNDGFKLREDFSEHGDQIGLGSFQTFLIILI
jgi:hypothetical protein